MIMDPERRRRLVELGRVHDEWVDANLAQAAFRPGGRVEGSDYNQHFADLEARPTAEDEFHRRAAEIMRLT